MSKQIEKITTEELELVDKIVIFGTELNMYGGNINRPIFLAQDIAELIEYSVDKVGQMLETVDDDEKLTDTIYRSGQKREMWFLTENGLYELLMQSRKPLAKKFKSEIKKILHKVRTGQIRIASIVANERNLILEDVRLIWKNFSGKETKFSKEGIRTFNVVLEDEERARKLSEDGWNVKIRPPREEGDKPLIYLPVEARFDNFPPEAYLIRERTNTKVILDEKTIGNLDYADIATVDVTISASKWDINGKTGIKGYLKTLYATVNEDLLSSKYSDYEEVRDSEDEDDDLPF